MATREGNNVLRSQSGKALENIDFEEEERLEREATDAERNARLNRTPPTEEVVDELLVVEKVKKKKKKEGEGSKKVKKKKKKEKSSDAV